MREVEKLFSSFQGLQELLTTYNELDSLITNFKAKTQLDCLKGCRKCCHTPAHNIEASVLEMLPLSIHIWQSGQEEYWLQKLSETRPEDPCVLYIPNPSIKSEGGCSKYTWRPLLCRLFGFSAVTDKQGKPVVALCKKVKQLNPDLEAKIQCLIDGGLKVPINSHFAERVSFLNPFFGQTLYPINEAFRLALEVVGYRLTLISRHTTLFR
ncbi:MAG: YkgJ family cysteine cluster protein [Bacillota bacterium]|uniref:YkgJ family cysteine cluster protein n=1 Tax=Thermanaerosceptrum fracticalcis TaxID=1712410 RepID=A0A7G6E2R9_THEFR|nr:YkgJ family cysteine cluster protein [Thermanaerosceptrum fracticalcis]QNB46373.1 YkgJ family cysteine cluster protein [Thermanaerosceptrum fracticalcis]